MRHLVLHEAAILTALAQGHSRLGAATVDQGDLWVVDGRPGDTVALITLAPGKPLPRQLKGPRKAVQIVIVVQEGDTGLLLSDGRRVRAHRHSGRPAEPLDVSLMPVDVDVFDRVRGIFETDVLRDSKVAILGVGSGGSFVARELAKTGVGHFVLVDHDRMEVGNVCRHECGLSDLGRLKVHAVADVLRDRNPAVQVRTLPLRIQGSTLATIESALADVDLVICTTDNRESRMLVNRVAVRQDKPALYGAVFRRAYGGQVLRVIPGLTPCYQCFVDALPAMVSDQEISSADAAANIAYSDRVVPIEPGLNVDLLPVGLQMAKLAILHLLGDRQTTLASLRRDLVAPLYLWLNRREAGTDYATLPPLENRVDSMTILRWYGIYIARNAACPVCGSFEEHLLSRYGVEGEEIDLTDFAEE